MNYRYSSDEPAFTPANVDIQTVTRKRNYTFNCKDGRIKHGFLCTVKKSIRYDIKDNEKTRITTNEGELLFIPKGCVYSSTFLDDETTVKIIQFDILNGTLPEYLAKPIKIDFPDVAEQIRPFFARTENDLPMHPFYYLSCIYALLWHIDEYHCGIPTKYSKLRPALEELSGAPEKNESIAYYSSLCNMSEVNFRRLFKEYTGKSPVEYRNDSRLAKAKIILQSKELNVAETAEECGFSNLSFFIRLYKKRFGHTPKKE